jgi:hypothetical protein
MPLTVPMENHRDGHSITRLEIVETGRRWRRSENETVRIIEESLSVPQLPSGSARQHEIANQRLRACREGWLGDGPAEGLSAAIVPDPTARIPEPSGQPIEIVGPHGRRVVYPMMLSLNEERPSCMPNPR